MPIPIKGYRIFIASPGDLDEEQKILRETIENLNKQKYINQEVLFIPVSHRDVAGGSGRAQSLINSKLEECEFLFGMFYIRFGSRPGSESEFDSGTEEEILKALAYLKDPDKKNMINVAVFFKNVPPSQMDDPGDELKKVLDFREKIKEKIFYKEFDNIDDFKNEIIIQIDKFYENTKEIRTPKRQGIRYIATEEEANSSKEKV